MTILRLILLFLLGTLACHAEVRVQGLSVSQTPEKVRLVFDLSGPVEHRVFTLSGPERVVLDLENAGLARSLPPPGPEQRLISGIRSAMQGSGGLRIVLDLRARARPQSSLLRPEGGRGHRLVLDLAATTPAREPAPTPSPARVDLRDVVIAIDAGHGGVDPGATGPGGSREKEVVLQVARELARLIGQERGMRAVMVRKGDQFLRLRKRIDIARQHKADLFVSIHADAYSGDARVSGSSVYALSERGATSEAARWLAERENAADLLGGVTLDDKDDLLASVLLDLSQTATIEASLEAGDRVLRALKGVGGVHKERVQQAGFAVLKSPDIPSILVETAFISNPQEEQKLADPKHQRAMARAILVGLKAYFAEHAPPGTLLAAREHLVADGDTLPEIARRYRVSLENLRGVNELRGGSLRLGQVLRIPAARGG
jgi:N-acetylmuramoyl-L-alanine amidase